MARTKTNTRRSKTVPAQDRYTAELSAGQLVIGMSILLMICLASFLMGVVVGKFDPSLNPEIALESLPVLEAAPAARSVQQNIAAAEPSANARKEPPPEMRVPKRTERDAAAGGASPSRSEDQAKASGAAAVKPLDTSKPKDEPVLASGAPAEALDEKAVRAEAGTPERTQTAAVLRTRYGVQVAAFQTRQRAEVVKRDLEAKSSYQVSLVLSSSGRLVKVVVGSYADRQSVNKVRDDLKQNFGYADCFVTTRQ